MYGGEIFKLTEHTERLLQVGGNPRFYDTLQRGEIDKACKETCAKNGLADCYVRPIAWRGSEMIGVSAQNTKIHLAIAAWEWPSYFNAGGEGQGHPPHLGQVPAPLAGNRADRTPRRPAST